MSDLDRAIREQLDEWAPTSTRSKAIRAVLDLHQPKQQGTLTPWHVRCVECSMQEVTWINYPCPTVQAIATCLGVETKEDDHG